MPRGSPSQVNSTVVVCIDSYDSGVLKGRLFQPGDESEQHFDSMSQFLLQLDRILDDESFPQNFNAVRTFSKPVPPPIVQSKSGSMKGKLATFPVWILFRQNASWQGNVRWLEEGRDQSFRSALELIFLMDSVLSGNTQNQAG